MWKKVNWNLCDGRADAMRLCKFRIRSGMSLAACVCGHRREIFTFFIRMRQCVGVLQWIRLRHSWTTKLEWETMFFLYRISTSSDGLLPSRVDVTTQKWNLKMQFISKMNQFDSTRNKSIRRCELCVGDKRNKTNAEAVFLCLLWWQRKSDFFLFNFFLAIGAFNLLHFKCHSDDVLVSKWFSSCNFMMFVTETNAYLCVCLRATKFSSSR